MSKAKAPARFAAAVTLSLALAGCAHQQIQDPKPQIDYVRVSPDITLRTMVYHHPDPAGIVLLLHGFPETAYTWKPLADNLGRDYEVHAFDWPGYGQSSRPPVEKFSYSPRDYSVVLDQYIEKAHIDRSKLIIYATDIGGLPPLLLAMDKPTIARKIIVGDFAPFNRPDYMWDKLRLLKTRPSADAVRAAINTPQARDETLKNAFTRGLPPEAVYDTSEDFKKDLAAGWDHDGMSTADAFYYYYINFNRDEDYLEANLGKLKTPVEVVWGEKDFYINPAMGREFADKAHLPFRLLPGMGHYPHLQAPDKTAEEIRAAAK